MYNITYATDGGSGIRYNSSSTGSIKDCNFNNNYVPDGNLISVAGDVTIDNCNFTGNNQSGSVLSFTSVNSTVSNSVFKGNNGTLRNINVTSPATVNTYNNTFDATVLILNEDDLTYGDEVEVEGEMDAGINYPIVLKSSAPTNTLNVAGNGLFKLSIPRCLPAGIYSLTLTDTDENNNTYNITYLNLTINQAPFQIIVFYLMFVPFL